MSATASPQPGVLTLHHLNNSQSQRILWLLEELSLEYSLQYNLILHERVKQRAPPELIPIHPLGRAPILITADGRTITESYAIASYLLRTYDTKHKFSSSDDIRDESLCSFAASSLSLVTTQELVIDLATKHTPWPFSYLVKKIKGGYDANFSDAEYKKNMTYLEAELGDGDFFNGSVPGRSDVMISWPLDVDGVRGFVDFEGEYPKLNAWRLRVQARPAWKSGLEKGNEYDLTAFDRA